MSQENVELVRSIYQAWLRGEGGIDKLDPAISMVESSTIPGAASAKGIEAVERGHKQTSRENPPGETIPAIDHDLKRIGLRRREATRDLRRELKRDPRDIEIAVEVVKAYSEQATLVKTALRKLERLAEELKTYEYVFPGMEDVAGRKPLPEPRNPV